MSLQATARFTANNQSALLARVALATHDAVEASCSLIQGAAQAICPVDTGALRDSISVQVEDSGQGSRGVVSVGMFYADYVEYGTGRKGDPSAPYAHVEDWAGMVPQPFMRPALDENQAQIPDIFREQLGGALG
jgi:HK97 gp10 family phage protein